MLEIITISIPNLVHLNALNPSRYPFLLETKAKLKGEHHYSFLFTHPQDAIILNDIGQFSFLDKLDHCLSLEKNKSTQPFTGGYFVYLSYELIAQLEPKLAKKVTISNEFPIAYAVKIDSAIIIDHDQNKAFIVDKDNNKNRINQIQKDLKTIANQTNQTKVNIQGSINNDDHDIFVKNIEKIKDYIKQGDVFQVNLSRLWQINLTKNHSANTLYQALQHHNPAPFSALASFSGFDIISSSPERLFSVSNKIIQTRPIAGTRPRGNSKQDTGLKQELLNHPKEQAEHIMLIDLERNDMGRICQYGSIKIDDLMMIETYPSVHHIVSNISGKLNKKTKFSDIIKAIFPGGTITGCPKIRCMEIIAQLENATNRGAYTGSIGYISNNGKMDFNILIRSLIKKDNNLSLRTGAGIVYDSDAKKEALETQYKAKGVLSIIK